MGILFGLRRLSAMHGCGTVVVLHAEGMHRVVQFSRLKKGALQLARPSHMMRAYIMLPGSHSHGDAAAIAASVLRCTNADQAIR